MEAFEKLKIISTLTSGIVHDINNVLTTIIGYTDILLSKDSCIECRDEIEIIKRTALDGAEITKRIKDFAKTKESNKKIFNVCETLQTSIMITKPIWFNQAQISGKKITVNYNNSLPILLYGNESELREAFVNMILNSIDAIQNEGFIEIEAYKKENNAVIKIKDNGMGMAEDTKSKIFTPFFTTKEENGSGLGLSNSYSTITGMGGKIEVESNLNTGTEFIIILPAINEINSQQIEKDKSFLKISQKILIIDDQIEICSVVKEMLSKIVDGKIETSTRGKDALKLLEENNYDIVITDIAMPDINGIEIIKYIKTLKPGTKVIAMTGWNGFIEKDNSIKPDYILSKPFTMEDLESGISSMYEQRDNLVV